MKKLKPKTFDWILLGVCFALAILFLVPELIKAHELIINHVTRITHELSHADQIRRMVESQGWVLTICKYFAMDFAGILVLVFIPFAIAARWCTVLKQHLKPLIKILLLILVIVIGIIIYCIDPLYLVFPYLLLWLIDIVYVIAKLARYLYFSWKAYKSTTTLKEQRKHLCFLLLSVLIACVAITVACDAWVRINAKGSLYDQMDDLPHNKVGLLLGTAPFTPLGEHNYYFDYRIEAASALFHAGKVEYILVSGDCHAPRYNEPLWMRDSLMAHGVPENRIVLDYAGFRTIDSVVRAKEIFGQDSLTIISQQFHNERALYLAHHNGIHAVAFNARDVMHTSKWLKIHTRELLARVKLFIDLAIGKQLHFLGQKELIGNPDNNASS